LPGVAALLQLTFDVSRPLRSAGEFVALASKDPEGMEARIARLESDVAHIRSDVAELKADVRSLRDKMDALNEKFDAKIAQLRDSLASLKVWALTLYIALAGALFGVLARGFGWI
jgi:uncharacterized protein YlxW (UPF0749 family)